MSMDNMTRSCRRGGTSTADGDIKKQVVAQLDPTAAGLHMIYRIALPSTRLVHVPCS